MQTVLQVIRVQEAFLKSKICMKLQVPVGLFIEIFIFYGVKSRQQRSTALLALCLQSPAHVGWIKKHTVSEGGANIWQLEEEVLG